METRRGIAVSPGVAIGSALVLDPSGVVIARRSIASGDADAEVQRLADALGRAAVEARDRAASLNTRLTPDLARDIGGILSSQALLLEHDHVLRYRVEALIRGQNYSAEYAMSRAISSLVRELGEAGGSFSRLGTDLRDLETQVLRILVGSEHSGPIASTSGPVVVLAHDLTPSETVQLDPGSVHAFATESGGPTSHTAIMAGALEIPAVVGIGRFLDHVNPSDTVIVDGTQGLLIVNPDEATIARYQAIRAAQPNPSVAHLEPLRDVPAITRDGVRLRLLGNIEFPNEAAQCVDRGAEGVGLYRTEFLYVNKTADPTEEEHFEAYREVLSKIGPSRPVVIRTLDIGADKFSSVSGMLSGEKNPFLGLRSVRLCLKNLDLFKTQLRAILRASVHGDVRIMFPMISTVMELRHCKSLLLDVQEHLEEEGIPFKRDIPIGTMIEVPSAALLADVLAKQVDFFSIGTNDLVQYTLAADRNNENVASLYNPVDPAVLRLIKMVVDAAKREQVEVNVCGEMSGEPIYTPLLVGLGLRQFSATPRKLAEVKRVIRELAVSDAEHIVREAMQMESAREVTTYLREQLRRILPDTTD